MRALRLLLARLGGVRPSGDRVRELDDELESHLQFHIDDNIRAGMTPQQARREAVLKLGGIEPVKEAYRDAGSVPFMEHLLQDIKFSVRQVRKNPAFTTTAILMLALGMCASVAIFVFVDGALIKPLPYKDPARLAGVFESVQMFPKSSLSWDDYKDWKRLNTVFSSLDVYNRNDYGLSTPTGVEPVKGGRVSDGFFRTLGVHPIRGRDFFEGEDSASAVRTVLLSYGAWQKRFGGSESAIGQAVVLDGHPYVIIGVLAREFHFSPAGREFWMSFHPESECDLRRSCHSLDGIGRLKDGVTLGAALANLTSIAQQLEKQYPGSNGGQGAAVAPLTEVIVGNIRPILLLLLCGAALLLLIATVNVAGLLLVRSETRKREIALRTALGASKGRIFSQFVTEGVVLVAAGTVIGITAAGWAIQLLTKLIPANMLANMPLLQDLELMNIRVLGFAGVIAILAVVLFALTPAIRLSSPDVRGGLAEGSRGSAGTVWNRVGGKLVVLELAIAVVLLVSAGLLGKSVYQLLHVDLGFQPERLLTIDLSAPKSVYEKKPLQIALARQLISKFENMPGVTAAGIAENGVPLDGNGNTTWFRVLGRPWHGEHNETPERDVSANYFKVLGAKLVRGRFFDESEDSTKPKVAIINRALARKYFPNEDPIGKQISELSTPPKPIEIVGLVDDIREGELDAAIPPVLYFPFNQNPNRYFGVVVRTSQPGSQMLPSLIAAVREINSGIIPNAATGMDDKITDSPSAYMHRSAAWLVGAFAALALLLSVIGLYGVVAYSVSQRTREIGVRMALGAQAGGVYRMVLGEACWLAATGIGVGLVCSVAAASLMSSLLFGVHSWDVPTLVSVAVLLGLAAMLASFIPARRAASVNPVEALRAE